MRRPWRKRRLLAACEPSQQRQHQIYKILYTCARVSSPSSAQTRKGSYVRWHFSGARIFLSERLNFWFQSNTFFALSEQNKTPNRDGDVETKTTITTTTTNGIKPEMKYIGALFAQGARTHAKDGEGFKGPHTRRTFMIYERINCVQHSSARRTLLRSIRTICICIYGPKKIDPKIPFHTCSLR